VLSFKKTCVLCCVILIGGLPLAMSQQNSRPRTGQVLLDDPVFGISYDPSLNQYERVPASLDKKCHLGGGHWIYAHASRKDSEYFVVMGYGPRQEGDSFGNSIWIKGAECRMDESNWALSGIPPEGGYRNAQTSEVLPGLDAPKVCENRPREEYCRYILRSHDEEAVLRSLVEDGIQRAVKAFGKAQFRKKECSAEALSKQSDYPIVQMELRRFCANSD